MTVPGRRWPARLAVVPGTQHLLCPPGGKHAYRQPTFEVLQLLSNRSDLILSVPVILAGTKASGQVDRAVLEGTVTDPSGSVIVGATLKVLAVDTGITQEQSTNSKGYYRFPGLAVGQYYGDGHEDRLQNQGGGRRRCSGWARPAPWTFSLGSERSTKRSKSRRPAPADRSSAEAATVIDTDQIAEPAQQRARLGKLHAARAVCAG